MKKKKGLLITCGMVIIAVLCAGVYIIQRNGRFSKAEVSVEGFSNQYDDIFDGSEGMEITLTGRVGYNYAFTLPNEVYMKFGFDPRNTKGEGYDFFGLGCGWKIKLPFLDVKNNKIYRSNGYVFSFVAEDKIKNPFKKAKGNYVLKAEENSMLRDVQEEYEIYDASGRLVNQVRSSDKKITYTYKDGFISQIDYIDGSVVSFERTENEVQVIYTENEENITMAIFKLEEAFGKVVLKEIVLLENETVSFEYITDTDNGLLLKSYDNGKYKRTIEYMEDSYKITGYQQVYEDNSTRFENYEYGPYDYVSTTEGTLYTEKYSYEKLENNCLKITQEKFPEKGQDSKDINIFNEFGERFSNRQEISVPEKKVVTLTYEENALKNLVESLETAEASETTENLGRVTEDGKMIITIMTQANAQIYDWDNNLMTQAIEEQFDVECEFIILPNYSGINPMSILYNTEMENYPDMIIGRSYIADSVTMELAEEGIITPIDEYVLDAEKTPYFNALPEDIKEECLRKMKQADGHIYGFANYVKSPVANNPERMWINKNWLDKLGLEVPKTTDELKEVLIAFRDGDPNGNGIADEIGAYGKRQGYAQDIIPCLMNSFLETSWNNGKMNSGLAVDQETGESVVAPFATEGWKEGLKYLNDLYEEGVLSPAIFTDDEQTYKDTLNSNPGIVSLTNMKDNTTITEENLREQFTYIAPLNGPEGYSWFPTRSSEFNVEVLFTCEGKRLEKCIAIQDAMYDCSTPESLGIIRLGRGEYGVDWTDDPEVLKNTSNIYVEAGLIDSLSYVQLIERPMSHNWNWGQGAGSPENGIIWTQGANLYEGVYDINTATDAWMLELLEALGDSKYVPKTLPILEYTEVERIRLNQDDTRSNIILYVNNFLEECITGVRDVETSWDAYLAELEALGLHKWLEIAQQAYDRQR